MPRATRGRDTETAQAVARGPSPEVIDALYRALLGRPPDAEGAEFWGRAETVDDVIEGLVATPEHRQRVIELATGYGGGSAGAVEARAITRLQMGNGEVTLDEDVPGGVLKTLETFPMSEVTRGLNSPTVQVLGPYATHLAEELTDRQSVDATCGFELERDPDVLVLTDPAYVQALWAASPATLDAVRLRLITPIRSDLALTDAAVAAELARRRGTLHDLGYIEVLRSYRRRFGDVTTTVDASHTTPDLHQPRVVEIDPVQRWTAPTSFWLIANRVPAYDRVG
jgi:hypothetical protein